MQGTIEDYTVYYTEMDTANRMGPSQYNSPLTWKQAFSAKESYNLSDFSPASWDLWYQGMLKDDEKAQLYFDHKHRFSLEYPAMTRDNATKTLKDIKKSLKTMFDLKTDDDY